MRDAAWRPEERVVFLVMGRSYEDSYVESIWETREAAEKRAAELPSDPPDYFQYEVIARGVM